MKRNSIDGIAPRRKKVVRKRIPVEPTKKTVKKITVDGVDPSTLPSRMPKKPFISSFWKRVLVTCTPVVLGLVASIVTINQFDSAQVRIQPHRDLVSIDSSIQLQKTAGLGELDFAVIAVTDNIELPIKADTVVPVNSHASGMIRIFNEYSSAPQRLSPSTRFESVEGKIYMISDEGDLIVPGKTEDGPGEITVMVYASEAGEAYNIDVTDFSIPGFNELGLDDKYQNIYALSTEAFTGGHVGTEPAISEELRALYAQNLKDELTEKLQHRLLTDKTFDMMIINNTSRIDFNDVVFKTTKDGNEGILSASGTLFSLLVSTKKLGTYLAQQELAMLDTEEVTLDETSTVTVRYTGERLSYESLKEVPVIVSGQAFFVWSPNIGRVSSELLGAKKSEIPVIADTIRSIGSINIKNHPRWRSTLPNLTEAITIKVISD